LLCDILSLRSIRIFISTIRSTLSLVVVVVVVVLVVVIQWIILLGIHVQITS
jgi:hypothetical protein